MSAGTSFNLKFENKSNIPLYLTIFYFGPTWGIQKAFPPDADHCIVNPGSFVDTEDYVELYLQDNPDPTSLDVDYFKAFITTHETSFRSLELSKLSPDGTALVCDSKCASHDLEVLLDVLNAGNALDSLDSSDGHGRNIRVTVTRGWVTAEIKICTIPKEGYIDCLESELMPMPGSGIV